MMRSRSMRGSTLLEAAIACALLAVTALGVVAALLAAMRGERDAAAREQAMIVADSWSEMARAGALSGVDWDASMSGLRHGKLVATGSGAGVSSVRVEWERLGAGAAGPRHCDGDVTAAQDVAKPCVTLAYASTDHQ
ncbi:hypothetical protein [Burkholderia thailandensis]|uniref:type IV pilus modification PilV family protein n=1 Tax=Burkholderia thailandensis TaxID=57975 RepID=UPI00016A53D7|nr:hypothetical protein [Burkholderia thailandensis]AVR25470.1 hypothetical protein A8H32_10405 [Burkholderia thailandensis]MDD1479080.1 hypothetical protein [Burkholderia thailandensis]MDD1485883.1 hypothetical protein [Burkholderia thailandensis]MDD1490951.1 hypothetical protein [Burkholderia thailandensis]PNE74515.1 hypothetical protein A8H37_22290 [Burkholderia thailandensis]